MILDQTRLKSVYERELLAIVVFVTRWRHYLTVSGNQLIIKTYQKILKHLLEQRFETKEQQRWATKLMDLDYTIKYKPGTEKVADALLRRFSSERLLELVFLLLSHLMKQNW